MTNKKRLAIIISAVIVVIAAAGAGVFAYASDVAKKNSIGIDSALNIAMADAGVTEENTIITNAKMDFEKGVFVYDIEFNAAGSGEYDYIIKASDGTILEKELDNDNISANDSVSEITSSAAEVQSGTETTAVKKSDTADTTVNNSDKTAATVNTSSDISLEKAKSIALNDAGLSDSNVQFTQAKKETDDGNTHYDIEFKTSSYEYEYEIDLKGNIISYDKDPIKNKTTTAKSAASSSNSHYIGVDKAKSIALNHAGLSASKVNFTKAKLEKDDGIYIYEIEFDSSGIEYEYEINATSGKIVSHSSEPYDD